MNEWDLSDVEFDETKFGGAARLFPLPDLVLFPHVVQPLHVFEDRYREMLEDAVADDSLIAIAMFEPGWEMDYDSRPPLAPVACLGKVIAHNRLDDGRYNLLLLGVRRVTIVRELAPLRSFRQAEVQIVHEQQGALPPELRRSLVEAFRSRLPAHLADEDLSHLLSDGLPMRALTDLVAYALPLPAELKRRLLGEPIVGQRARLLLKHLRESPGGPGTRRGEFPPPFSDN
ncbi:Lon protease [Pirellulimonas nuda]|uniref:Lon protease n=1 Tax=Pirellulimonas nuda TaxID=2528009 RepID=A0A518DF71_9BACT|nr:LON peptidase substrate-binding domain-containing protein [Pirellulimonas nuda]QDU90134.1 Lon protease [Pirellulimonas nuda]